MLIGTLKDAAKTLCSDALHQPALRSAPVPRRPWGWAAATCAVPAIGYRLDLRFGRRGSTARGARRCERFDLHPAGFRRLPFRTARPGALRPRRGRFRDPRRGPRPSAVPAPAVAPRRSRRRVLATAGLVCAASAACRIVTAGSAALRRLIADRHRRSTGCSPSAAGNLGSVSIRPRCSSRSPTAPGRRGVRAADAGARRHRVDGRRPSHRRRPRHRRSSIAPRLLRLGGFGVLGVLVVLDRFLR